VKYFNNIQSEFVKIAYNSWWNILSPKQRMKYLTLHPKSSLSEAQVVYPNDRVIIQDPKGNHFWGTIRNIYKDQLGKIKLKIQDDRTGSHSLIEPAAIVASNKILTK
jgi:hypothetical protein